MNYLVYVNGVHLPRVDSMITTDGYLKLREAPAAGSHLVIQVQDGWNQGFVGTGTTVKFPLSDQIINSMAKDTEFLEYTQILYEAMRHLDSEAVRAEVARLATVVAMTKSYDKN